MFIPSPYHERIFDFFDHDTRNGLIAAVAGSGKTTLLVELLKRVPAKKRVLVAAFNTDTAKEIDWKQKTPNGNYDISRVAG